MHKITERKFFLAIVVFLPYFYNESAAQVNCRITSFDETENVTASCTNIVVSNVTVPAGETFVLNLIDNSSLTFEGVTRFENTSWNGPLLFVKGKGLTVGTALDGALDGQGFLYWDGKGEGGAVTKPLFFHIEAHDSVFKNINILNCPLHCTDIADSTNVTFYNWNINNTAGQSGIAPKGHEGHNTDGFFIYTSHNIVVKDSVIVNQDDCAVIRSGSNITVCNLHCTGSHGLSLSVGDSKTSIIENTVKNITFEDSVVVQAEFGIHVKTHVDGANGSISDVTYRNITFSVNVLEGLSASKPPSFVYDFVGVSSYGIIVQQDYVNGRGTKHPKGNIPIENLSMINIKGSLRKGTDVFILCAEGACFDWHWSNVSVTGGSNADNCTYVPDGYTC